MIYGEIHCRNILQTELDAVKTPTLNEAYDVELLSEDNEDDITLLDWDQEERELEELHAMMREIKDHVSGVKIDDSFYCTFQRTFLKD